jgi:hypothetical protein
MYSFANVIQGIILQILNCEYYFANVIQGIILQKIKYDI